MQEETNHNCCANFYFSSMHSSATSKKCFGLMAVFSFVFAAFWWFFYTIAGMTGGQIVIGANNMSTAMNADELYRTQADKIMTDFQAYFEKFHHLQFDWTIGPAHYLPLYLVIFFGVSGVVFLVLHLKK